MSAFKDKIREEIRSLSDSMWRVESDHPNDRSITTDTVNTWIQEILELIPDPVEKLQEIAILQLENKKYKDALELVAAQCLITFQVFESTDDTQDILDTVCYALGLDYDTEVEKAETKGRKEMEDTDD